MLHSGHRQWGRIHSCGKGKKWEKTAWGGALALGERGCALTSRRLNHNNRRRRVKALERSYDGIIIGAGQHGLVLGSYLARAGLSILLVERRLTYGGGLSTREVTAPGFYHNLHSINHFHITETPWFKDLGLDARVGYITPRYEFGQAHLDGTALVLGRDLDETVANIARFSRRDAATFREWNRKAEAITGAILLPERYAEPLPQGERE